MEQHPSQQAAAQPAESFGQDVQQQPAAAAAPYTVAGSGVRVHVATLLTVHDVTVLPLRCAGCGQVWQVQAPHLNCMPGNSNALELRRRDQPIIWFSMVLLQHMDAIVRAQGSLSTHKYTAALVQQWSANMEGDALQAHDAVHMAQLPAARPLPFTVDTLERQLGSALREYQYWESRMALAAEQHIKGWPLSAQRPCACCTPEATHQHFDVCFGLCKHKRSGHSIQYAAPDNRRVFMDNQQLQDRLRVVDALVKQAPGSSWPAARTAPSPPPSELMGAPRKVHVGVKVAVTLVPKVLNVDPHLSLLCRFSLCACFAWLCNCIKHHVRPRAKAASSPRLRQ